MMKNILIIAGLILIFYACTPAYAQPIPPTQAEVTGCYERVNAAAREQWAQMNKLQRFTVGMRAISACEGGN